MINILTFLIFNSFEFPYFEAPKETLFIWEPIFIQPKFKNKENNPKKLIFKEDWAFGINLDRIYFVHNKDTFFFDLSLFGICIDAEPPSLDTFIIQPNDSIYGNFNCVFLKDFLTKDGKPFLFPTQKEILPIKFFIISVYCSPEGVFEKLDSIILFFRNSQREEKEAEIINFLASFRDPILLGSKIVLLNKIKNLILKYKYSNLLPYLYFFYYKLLPVTLNKIYEGFSEKERRENREKIRKIIKMREERARRELEKEWLNIVKEMKKKFPNHFLTRQLEFNFIFGGPKYTLKNREKIKWEKELMEKYPSYYESKRRAK
ncbi:MAG: hypothetical protein QXF09_06410 [Nitrososphaerota archaeon]